MMLGKKGRKAHLWHCYLILIWVLVAEAWPDWFMEGGMA